MIELRRLLPTTPAFAEWQAPSQPRVGRRCGVALGLRSAVGRSVKEVCLSDGAATVRAGSGFGVDGRQ